MGNPSFRIRELLSYLWRALLRICSVKPEVGAGVLIKKDFFVYGTDFLFPVLDSFSGDCHISWFLLTVEPLLGYNLTCLIDLVLISVITVGLSELSVRYVEPLSGKLTALLDKQ